MKTLTARFSDFIEELSYDNIPPSVISRFKSFILDYIAVTLAGSTIKSSQIMINTISELDKSHDAVIIGCPRKASFLNAPLINGTSGHALEFDDDHRFLACILE